MCHLCILRLFLHIRLTKYAESAVLVYKTAIIHLYCNYTVSLVGCRSANQARLDLDLPSYVPGGSELGGDDMCSVCMDHVG